MTHYEARLESDLADIRSQLRQLGAALEASLRQSVQALLGQDRDLAWETAIQDQSINRRAQVIDRMCHAFVARHLPSARHLRFVSSVLRVNISLERVGDYAVTICREANRIQELPEELRRDIEQRWKEAGEIFHHALQAFESGDEALARSTRKMTAGLARAYETMLLSLVQATEAGSIRLPDSFSVLLVLNRLSRVCDQAKNLCEAAVYVATGEEKKGKVFKILLVDRSEGRIARVAQQLTESVLGESARVSCAHPIPDGGKNPTEAFGILPAEALQGIDLVITLEPGLEPSLGRIPYHTVFLDWSTADPSPTEAWIQAYRKRLGELSSILTGNRY